MYLGSKSFPLQNYPATTPFPELGSPRHCRHLEFYFIFPLKPVVVMIEASLRLEQGRTPFWVRERCVKHHSYLY